MIERDGVCTHSDYEDGCPVIQVDVYGESAASCENGQQIAPYGCFSRPHDPLPDPTTGDPDPANACTALYGWLGDRLFVLPIQDTRQMSLLPSLEKGSGGIYGGPWLPPGPGWAYFDGTTGKFVLKTPIGQSVSIDTTTTTITSLQSFEVDSLSLTLGGPTCTGVEIGGPAAQPLVSEPLLSAQLQLLYAWQLAVQTAISALTFVPFPLPATPITGIATLITKAA